MNYLTFHEDVVQGENMERFKEEESENLPPVKHDPYKQPRKTIQNNKVHCSNFKWYIKINLMNPQSKSQLSVQSIVRETNNSG